MLDDGRHCTKEDITLVSQGTPRSYFTKYNNSVGRYGTIVAIFPYTTSKILLCDAVRHDDICRVMQLVYSGLANKVIFVAKSWQMLDTLLKHENHTNPCNIVNGMITDTQLNRLK